MNVKMTRKLNNEKLKKWKEGHLTITLNPDDIIITESIHIKAKQINFNSIMAKYQNKTKMDRVLVVRKLKNKNKYTLVMGIKWLTVAKLLNLSVNCIVVKPETTHKKLRGKIGMVDDNFKAPEGTDFIYPISKVAIPYSFRNTTPRKEKYEQYEEYFIKNGCIDKPITVIQDKHDKNAVVAIDKYIRYLVLVNNGVRYIPVRFAELTK